MENTKLTHGLLVEDFKQSIGNYIMSHSLDIQTKAIILDCLNTNLQKLAAQQTQKELEEYQAEQARIQKENENKETQEVSE